MVMSPLALSAWREQASKFGIGWRMLHGKQSLNGKLNCLHPALHCFEFPRASGLGAVVLRGDNAPARSWTDRDVMAKVGKIAGLRGRWLAHAVDDPDAGYTMSLWTDEATMRSYESGDVLQK